MPVWLIPLIISIGKGLWHALCRFWSIFLIGLVVLAIWQGVRAFELKHYNRGYKDGYAQATKDNPQHVGQIINNPDYKYVGIRVNVYKLRLGVGF